MTEGYIYCISNGSMPYILNIGMSWMTPALRVSDMNDVNDINISRLWYPPTPYKCEIAKKVLDPLQKLATIYKLLAQYRITPTREFFRISFKEVRALFDLMDGEYCIEFNPTNDMKTEKKKAELKQLNEDFEQRKAEIKIAEERILDCIFKKSDTLEADLKKFEVRIANKKTELAEINNLVEERKVVLANLTNDRHAYYDTRILRDQRCNVITEY